MLDDFSRVSDAGSFSGGSADYFASCLELEGEKRNEAVRKSLNPCITYL